MYIKIDFREMPVGQCQEGHTDNVKVTNDECQEDHPFLKDIFNFLNGQAIQLFWQRKGIQRQGIIVSSILFPVKYVARSWDSE